MTQVVSPFDQLRSAIAGSVVTPEDPGYDDARRVWNADIDRRPAAVAYCETTEDVATAVTAARRASLEISVRSGAHSTSGASVGDGGLVIDLSRMNDVEVDPERRRAVVGGGALLRDVDAATQAHGLAVPAGEIGHTGVAGLTLGGGMGWLTRRHGLTIDNLLSARVVLADGRVLRAAEDENPDLFWALTGGGGNFGIVTSFEFALHEVGPTVHVGMLFYGVEDGPAALRTARAAIRDLPADVTFQVVALHAPPAPFVPEEHRFRLVIALAVVGFGDESSFGAVVDRCRSGVAPLFEMVGPMPYTALQQMFDETFAWGVHCYEKATYVAELTHDVAETFLAGLDGMDSPLSVVHFYVLSGAYSEVAEEATAFSGGRSPRLAVFLVGAAADAAGLASQRAWSRAMFDALAPHSLGAGAYVNGMGADDAHRIRDSYGTKYDRLARIKAVYDPENVFHRNGNILPAR
ncbi:FAD-binding oxidoreductase [Actinomycetospora sp. TBRC 11914]|uniref:FAD-binding oxidoreductase n=1 Tax=Actinomycetospora sp. TBRC 11914 TaxID=2729387 RepID=UPI00145D0E41|nr:FAD-binding oxidoreductase [Actinomycetospora sp. TBRC 11914]NMO89799.1 FAD-binding oxidoreductase [Actinomycetospora sp. TBRC 11914]